MKSEIKTRKADSNAQGLLYRDPSITLYEQETGVNTFIC
jgi:hypothetical protein